MSADLHPAAPHHLPPFITAPGESDVLFVSMALFVLFAVIGVGVFYFKLHALPEHLAHRGQKIQFEIVAVLALIGLFTHNHAYWIAALLLALIPLPDLSTPLGSMARSLSRMAGRGRAGTQPETVEPPADEAPPEAGEAPPPEAEKAPPPAAKQAPGREGQPAEREEV